MGSVMGIKRRTIAAEGRRGVRSLDDVGDRRLSQGSPFLVSKPNEIVVFFNVQKQRF